jgi:hypothetical protein
VPRKKVTAEVAPVIDKLQWLNEQIAQYHSENILLDQIIEKGPQIKSTATGFPSLDFQTCTCGSFHDRRTGHADNCEVQAVTDPVPIVGALAEKRRNRAQVAELLKLRDAIQPGTDETPEIAEALAYLAQLAADNQRLTAEVEQLRAQLAALDQAEPAELVLSAAEMDARALWQGAHGNGSR